MKLKFRYLTLLLALVLSCSPFFSDTSRALPSADLVIYQVQTGGAISGTASEELVLIYNTAKEDVNVSGWCIYYSSSSNDPSDPVSSTKQLACVDPPDGYELWLKTGDYISFATDEFVAKNLGFISDFAFSAGLASTGGHVWIEDSLQNVIDLVGWGTAVGPETSAVGKHSSGEALSRNIDNVTVDTDDNSKDFSSGVIKSPITSGLYEVEVIVDLCANVIGLQASIEDLPEGYLSDNSGDCFLDVCSNLEGLQKDIPPGFYKLVEDGECLELALEDSTLIITELLPNAPSYDTGQEFIEIYNPNQKEVELKGYKLQLGPAFTKEYVFDSGIIGAEEYIIISDTQSGIVLPNTSSASVRLVAPAGNKVSESAVYSNADDDVSWALVNDVWIFTNQITPATENKPYLESAGEETLGVTSTLSPCPAGKFRNPETNRCKNIETAVSRLVPCKLGQVRNPETNRCRSIGSTSSSLVPCKAGQVRNPETNRCRSTSSSTLTPCKKGQERNPQTNRCRNASTLGLDTEFTKVEDIVVESTEGQLNWPIIILSVLSTFAYIAYEWRNEIGFKIRSIRAGV